MNLISPCSKPLQKIINIGKFEILLPDVFGFCGGVVHAMKLMEETIEKFYGRQIFILGEIIHNKNVNEYFISKSVKILPHDEIETIFKIAKAEDIIVIPAFGIPQKLENKIRIHFKNVIDTTCKDVKRVWDFITSESAKGSTILIHGHPFHPEVEASISRASDKSVVFVIPDMKAADAFIQEKHESTSFALANQTTMLYSETCAIEEYIRSKLENKGASLNACQTICKATYMRQIAAEKLLSDNSIDLVFVVGGYDSSNTNNLYKLSVSKERKTFYIGDSSSFCKDLILDHFSPEIQKIVHTDLKVTLTETKKIAILAGASCPVALVEEVIEKLSLIARK